ncbi:MAG: hypothetical protein SPG64_03425 [Candidatus Enteromonas sp.]|nr:hypothetical protein [Candidatus Enteromonas sp.]
MKEAAKGLSKDIFWHTVGTFAYMIALWVISILSAKLLDYESAGVFSLCLVASNIAMSFGSFYVRVFYAGDINHLYSDADYWFSRVFTSAASLLVAVVYSLGMKYPPDVFWAIFLFYIYKIFELFTEIHSGAFQRHGKMYLSGILNTVKGVASLGGFVLGAVLTHTLIGGFAFMIGVGLLVFIAELILLKSSVNVTFSLRDFSIQRVGKLLLHCLPFFVVLLCSNVLPSIPKAMFEKMYTTTEYGYYSSIATISVLIQTAAGSILLPVLPRIGKAYAEKNLKGFLLSCGGLVGFTVVLGLVAFVLVLFLGDWALSLVFDPSILQYSSTFKFTIIAGTATGLFVVLNQILIAMNDKFGVILGSVLGTLTCFGVSRFFIQRYYMDGVSFSLILSVMVEVVIFVFFLVIDWKKALHSPSCNNDVKE